MERIQKTKQYTSKKSPTSPNAYILPPFCTAHEAAYETAVATPSPANYGHQHLSGSTPEALIESHKPKPKKAIVRKKKANKTEVSAHNTVVL